MSKPPTDPPSIGYLTKGLQQLLRHETTAALAAIGMSLLEFTALSTVANTPRISNADLARKSFVTPQTVHRAVMTLEERGLLEREPAQSGRSQPMIVSAEGYRALDACDHVSATIHQRMLRGFSPKEIDALRGYLVRATANLAGNEAG